jgi:ribosomal protein S18 acetylase RimI-like enzyme
MSSETIQLRPYRPEDFAAVCTVHDRARPVEMAGSCDPAGFRPMTQVAHRDHFFDSVTWVACMEEKVVGFVSWQGEYISWLYVDPDYHRRGIGKMMLAKALKCCGEQAWTNAIADNRAAMQLYATSGFEVVKTYPGDCDGYPCDGARLALPTSRMRDPDAKR